MDIRTDLERLGDGVIELEAEKARLAALVADQRLSDTLDVADVDLALARRTLSTCASDAGSVEAVHVAYVSEILKFTEARLEGVRRLVEAFERKTRIAGG